VDDAFSTRRIVLALTGAAAVIAVGTVAFHHFSHEGWLQSFYRSVVTSSLTGLDTTPTNDSTRLISIVLVLAGLTIFAFIATILVEGIARGVFTGALAERRRKRAIDRLEDHYIICGYGRVGRRVADEFRDAGVDYVSRRPGSRPRRVSSPRPTRTWTTCTSRCPRRPSGPIS
jgi:voltage-gated potassium channel